MSWLGKIAIGRGWLIVQCIGFSYWNSVSSIAIRISVEYQGRKLSGCRCKMVWADAPGLILEKCRVNLVQTWASLYYTYAHILSLLIFSVMKT